MNDLKITMIWKIYPPFNSDTHQKVHEKKNVFELNPLNPETLCAIIFSKWRRKPSEILQPKENFFIQKQACPAVLHNNTKLQTCMERKKKPKQTENYYTNNTAKLSIQEVLFRGAFQEKYNNDQKLLFSRLWISRGYLLVLCLGSLLPQ